MVSKKKVRERTYLFHVEIQHSEMAYFNKWHKFLLLIIVVAEVVVDFSLVEVIQIIYP